MLRAANSRTEPIPAVCPMRKVRRSQIFALPTSGDIGSLEHRRDYDNLNQIPAFDLYPDTGALRPVFLWTNPLAPH